MAAFCLFWQEHIFRFRVSAKWFLCGGRSIDTDWIFDTVADLSSSGAKVNRKWQLDDHDWNWSLTFF